MSIRHKLTGLAKKALKWNVLKMASWINYKIQSGRKVKNCFISFAGGWDGAGAQIHSIISIISFAREFNITYVHTPVRNVEHFKGERDEWSEKWEHFFSLGEGELNIKSIQNPKFKTVYIKYPSLLWKRRNSIFLVSNCHTFANLNGPKYDKLLGALKEKYYSEPKSSFLKEIDKNTIRVCVHIRRGDVTEKSNQDRFTSNNFVLEKLKILIQVFKEADIRYQLEIFSEGEKENFFDLFEINPVFRLDEDEFSTFHNLVNADVLMLAKSSFSYVAGMLNDGIVLYDEYWHKPLPHWIILSKNCSDLKENFQRIFYSKYGVNKDYSRELKSS